MDSKISNIISNICSLTKSFFKNSKQVFIPIIIGFVVGAIVIKATGESVLDTYKIMFKGGFGNLYYLTATLTRATPIIICGLGAALAWGSGYKSIGAEGQLIVGGFITTVVALYMPGNPTITMFVSIIAGIIAGGLYSLVVVWLDDKFKVSLVISSLMLNYVADHITHYFVAFPLKDTTVDGIVAQTLTIGEKLRLPKLMQGNNLHFGFVLSLVLVAVLIFIMKKTIFGYESKMGGYNPLFAVYGGVNSKKVIYITMFLSGAIVALAGSSEVLGLKYRYIHGMLKSPGYAWTGLMAALISNNNPLGILITSIFLAGIHTGGAALERSTNIPLEISAVIQGVITLFVSAKIVLNFIKKDKKAIDTEVLNKEEGGKQA